MWGVGVERMMVVVGREVSLERDRKCGHPVPEETHYPLMKNKI